MGVAELVGAALDWARKQVGSSVRGTKRWEKIILLADKYLYHKFKPLLEMKLSFSPFQRSFLEAHFDLNAVRKALAHLKATLAVLADIRDQQAYLARKGEKTALKVYAGRARSAIERCWEDIQLLKKFRAFIRKIPPVKDIPTVVLAGFPNVGKSTLLGTLTGSKPKVAPYPFTTKSIMIGYMKCLYQPVQVLDTPGILDKPLDKLKKEEKIAFSAILHAADLIVFILDPLQPLDPQVRLLNSIKNYTNCPVIVVQNKVDAAGRAVDADIYISALTGEGVDELKKTICRTLGWEHGAERGSEDNG